MNTTARHPMKYGRHLSNIPDPRVVDARQRFHYSFQAFMAGPAAMEREWLAHLAWVNENIIGPPEATDEYTVGDLEGMGMVGVYKPPTGTRANATRTSR